jgi:carboxypeptidase T
MNKPLTLLATLWLLTFPITAQTAGQPETYSRVRIDIRPYGAMAKLMMSGVAIDHAMRDKSAIVAELSSSELAELHRAGISYQTEIADVAAFYSTRAELQRGMTENRTESTPLRFRLGSMGGHLILSEVYQALDSMRILYPNLISVRDSIGSTVAGRGVFAIKIGSAQSVGKPQVLYTSLHHAREPNGMMTLVYY